MKKYFEPILEIILVSEEDLICTSDEIPGGNLGGGEDELPVLPLW